MLKRHGIDAADYTVSLHPRSGRNRLYLIEGASSNTWLAKQVTSTGSAEAWFYRSDSGVLNFSPKLIFVDEELSAVVTAYEQNARTVQRIAVDRPTDAILHLASLGSPLGRLHAYRGSAASPTNATLPALDPIPVEIWYQCSPAAQELTRLIQASPLLGETMQASSEGRRRTGLIHGDLKIDNVLVRPDGSILLVDWECCGTGNVAADVGAVVGSMIALWVDHFALDDASQLRDWMLNGAVPFEIVRKSAHEFLSDYRAAMKILDAAPPDLAEVTAHIASWLIARSWADALSLSTLTPQLYLRVSVALGILKHADELWGHDLDGR